MKISNAHEILGEEKKKSETHVDIIEHRVVRQDDPTIERLGGRSAEELHRHDRLYVVSPPRFKSNVVAGRGPNRPVDFLGRE